LWIATNELPLTGGHPFYQRLNQVLDEHGFDAFIEAQCPPFYAATLGRPSLTPGTRLLLIGYFEGIDSERGIAWRTADSLALRGFLGLGLDETPPEHSTISRTRRLIDLETHRAVITWILQVLAAADLVKGKTIGIDATTLEANAALQSIVRRDSGETYQEFLTRPAQASGIETPTRTDLARFDRKRPKKGRNMEWRHPLDPDARITKMNDGRTHLAHKAEHAVDLETGAIVSVTVQGADQGDTTTIAETVTSAAEELEAVATATDAHTTVIEEVVADKGSTAIRCWWIWRPSTCGPTSPSPIAGWAAAVPERASGTPECASLRDRRHAAYVSARTREHLEAAVRAHRRLQSWTVDADARRRREATGPQGRVAALMALVITLWMQFVERWRDRWTPSADHSSRFAPEHSFERLPVSMSEGAVSSRAARASSRRVAAVMLNGLLPLV
jgi:transposase